MRGPHLQRPRAPRDDRRPELENTHPFCLGTYSFCHNGTVIAYPRLLEPGVPKPPGETDSEASSTT